VHSESERARKREEILTVARQLFVEDGYDAASMSRIAKEVGVAPNTIYWYFADKDALLIAVLDELVAEAAREYQRKRRAPLDAQVMWLLSMLESAEGLVSTVHARIARSEAVRVWHERFHAMLEAILTAELNLHGVPTADQRHAAQVAMFVIEGLLAHPTSTQDRRGLVRWMVSTLHANAAGA